MQVFQSPAVILAALGSLFTRAPLTAAMKAGASAMEGFHAGDKEVAGLHMEQWKANVDYAIKQNQVEMSRYQAIMENSRLSIADKQARMQAIAAANQDQMMMAAMASGNVQRVFEIMHAREQSNDKLVETQQKYAQQNEGRMSDEAVHSAAVRFIETGDKSVFQGVGRGVQGANNLSRIHNEIARAAGEMGVPPEQISRKVAAWGALVKADRDFSTGPQGNTIRSFSTAAAHMDTLQELADALNNGDVKAINAAKNRWQIAFGEPAPANFALAAQLVADEVLKAVLGGPGGVADRDKLAGSFAAAAGSPKQITGALDTARSLIHGQLSSLRDQYVQTGVGTPEQFNARLSPEAQKQLNKSSGGLPPEAVSMLKEGQETTFGNGQVWTRRNGEPVRVR
jgi:hypothetical protein